ncbi:MAG: Uma2 family endonuclease [Clostridiales bacterium]|nr:Uma2 family endonuclease [Clostridiales bacterium]
MEQLREQYYTYADYLTWDDDIHRELIDGRIVNMAPAPGWGHQSVNMSLAAQLFQYLEGKRCKVFTAPFDVRINPDTTDDTVVQPDITILCDMSKRDKAGCKGVPDMVVEILSPSSGIYDRKVKYDVYEAAGVREYWIVDPEKRTVEQYILKNGRYAVKKHGGAARVNVHVLEGCVIDLARVFANID